jgi:hypothetical protein
MAVYRKMQNQRVLTEMQIWTITDTLGEQSMSKHSKKSGTITRISAQIQKEIVPKYARRKKIETQTKADTTQNIKRKDKATCLAASLSRL